MLPEVISTIAQASNHHVNLDELMEKVGDRLAELLQVGWGIVTAGAAAATDPCDGRLLSGNRSGKNSAAAEPGGIEERSDHAA